MLAQDATVFLAHTRIVYRRLYYDYDWVEALNDAALAVAERSRTLYPESASSALMLGWVHLQAGNGPEAIDHLRRAAGPGPGRNYWACWVGPTRWPEITPRPPICC
ncbi:MAG: hypothetical protein M5U12_27865 [Verrucomicrobia bacterium]|nr:hypothetical protein [Verrucomicrobiota bacterium]